MLRSSIALNRALVYWHSNTVSEKLHSHAVKFPGIMFLAVFGSIWQYLAVFGIVVQLGTRSDLSTCRAGVGDATLALRLGPTHHHAPPLAKTPRAQELNP
jgi:hypothetical protein